MVCNVLQRLHSASKNKIKIFHIKCCQLCCICKDSRAQNIQQTQISVIHDDQRCLNSASEIPRHPVSSSYLLPLYNVPYVKCDSKKTKPRICLAVHAHVSVKAANYGLQC